MHFFQILQSEKFNPGSLSTVDLLRKDYKEYQTGRMRYAVSAVPISTAAWIVKDSRLSEEFRSYSSARKLDALITMQFSKSPEFTRELAVYSADSGLRRKLVDALVAADAQLEPIVRLPNQDAPDAVEFFKQKNTKMARKNIQGLFDQIQ